MEEKTERKVQRVQRVQPSDMKFKLSQTFTLRDLVTVISVAVSLSLAWGVFGTRLSLVEQQITQESDKCRKVETETETLKDAIRRLEAQHQYDGLLIDRLYEELRKTAPRRPWQHDR